MASADSLVRGMWRARTRPFVHTTGTLRCRFLGQIFGKSQQGKENQQGRGIWQGRDHRAPGCMT